MQGQLLAKGQVMKLLKAAFRGVVYFLALWGAFSLFYVGAELYEVHQTRKYLQQQKQIWGHD